MICTTRHRLRSSRNRARSPIGRSPWDRLESRIALSAVIGTSPSAGEILRNSPEGFHIRFDTPIDAFSIGFTDIAVTRVNDDGSTTPAFEESDLPYGDLDPDDPTEFILTPSRPLGPGRYRLVLSGASGLSDLDGGLAADPDGNDRDLADFTIARPGVGLSDAESLGTIGPELRSVAGELDFDSDPSAVKLYQFQLRKGHNWRLGVEVTAQRDGSPLNASLALFDATGQLLETGDLGRPDAPFDPFLFRGLKPGTYYIGVSGQGNLPDAPGGYDVTLATPGVALPQSGGVFTLNLVADEADLPGALVDFRVSHADPLDPTPTGFAVQFSTPLDLGGSGSDVFDKSTGGVQVVDSRGRAWPVAAVNYDSEHSAISFLFLDRLPEGRYVVKLDAENPLVDLAGIAPTSPTLPKGVLATFAVAPDLRARADDGSLPIAGEVRNEGDHTEDLGPLTPNLALDGIERTFTLEPGQSATLRFVNLYRDFYKIRIRQTGGVLDTDLNGGGQSEEYLTESGSDGFDDTFLQDFAKGEYFVKFEAVGDGPVTVTIRLSIGAFSWDSLLANGLGQGAALNLRLVSNDPFASLPQGSGTRITPNPIGSTATGPSAGPHAPSATPAGPEFVEETPKPAATEALTAALASRDTVGPTLDVGGTLVGRPASDADHVAAVGPASGAGSYALASAGVGPGQAIAASGSLRGSFSPLSDRPEHAEDQAPITDGSELPEFAPKPNREESGDAANAPKDAEVAQAIATGGEATVVEDAPADIPTEPADRSVEEEEEASSGIMPWVASLIGATAIGARWMKRRADARRSKPTFAARRIPAPHTPLARVRV